MTLLLLACDGQKADEGPYCEDTPTDVALDEVTELGFSGADVAALATGTWTPLFNWDDGGTTDLTLDLAAPTGGARFVDSVAVYPPGSEHLDIAVECHDRVEVDTTAAFDTADGAFAEDWPLTLRSEDGALATFWMELDPFGLNGTYDLLHDIEEPDWDEATMFVDARFDGVETTGSVRGQVSGVEECDGNECSAWAAEVPVGSWTTTPE